MQRIVPEYRSMAMVRDKGCLWTSVVADARDCMGKGHAAGTGRGQCIIVSQRLGIPRYIAMSL